MFLGILLTSFLLFSCATPEEPAAEAIAVQEIQVDNPVEKVSDDSDAQPVPQDDNINSIFINDKKLSAEQVQGLTTIYGAPPLPGHYWYDPLSGSYGIWQGPSLGLILPGHDFGNVPKDASAGNTGIFINGRELPEADVQFLEWVFAVEIQPNYYWQDALGNMGYEGDSTIITNLYTAYQQRSSAGRFSGSGDNYWAGNFGSYGNEQNGFGYVMVDGASVTYGG